MIKNIKAVRFALRDQGGADYIKAVDFCEKLLDWLEQGYKLIDLDDTRGQMTDQLLFEDMWAEDTWNSGFNRGTVECIEILNNQAEEIQEEIDEWFEDN